VAGAVANPFQSFREGIIVKVPSSRKFRALSTVAILAIGVLAAVVLFSAAALDSTTARVGPPITVTVLPTTPLPRQTVNFELEDVFYHQCLNGREGMNGVTMQPCGTQPQEVWTVDSSSELVNVFYHQCLNGREGANGVTMQPCHTQPQQVWLTNGSDLESNFNHQCLNGREGANGVNMQHCGTQPQQAWILPWG
jgi:hypothetical protein